MAYGLKPDSEKAAQIITVAADRLLKGAALVAIAGALVGSGIILASKTFWLVKIGIALVVGAASSALVVIGAMLLTFAFAGLDPTSTLDDAPSPLKTWVGRAFATVVALVIAAVVANI